jgi:hypothetical protein
MAFKDQTDLAMTPAFIARVQNAMVKSAIAVSAEDPATAYHAARVSWATQVLRDPARYATRVAVGVASNDVISLDSLDSDIEFTVNAQWNAYAGVVTAVTP